jgi:hypothetical protein
MEDRTDVYNDKAIMPGRIKQSVVTVIINYHGWKVVISKLSEHFRPVMSDSHD